MNSERLNKIKKDVKHAVTIESNLTLQIPPEFLEMKPKVAAELLDYIDFLRLQIYKVFAIVQDHAEGGNIENYNQLSDKLEEVEEALDAKEKA